MFNNVRGRNGHFFQRRPWTIAALASGLILITGEAPAQDRGRTGTLAGTLAPWTSVSIGSRASGVVTEVLCDFNMLVKKGQVCARIDPRPFQQRVEQARANLNRAKAELVKQQANLVHATTVYERNLQLSQRGVVSKATFESSESSFAQAKAQVEVDKAIVEQREAELRESELNLSHTEIESPIDGIVTERKVAVGETVTATFQTPQLFTISHELSKLLLTTRLRETEVPLFKEGEEVTFTVKAYSQRSFRGTVKQVRVSTDSPQSEVFFTALIEVDNNNLMLKPGMTATVRLTGG
jgi:HlyD family secretion protein